MVVYYDTEAKTFAIAPDDCDDCGEPLYDTGCDAPGCLGRCCMDCGTGCDIEFAPGDGTCAQALAAEPGEERDARFNKERAAFGLPALHGEGVGTDG